MSDSKKNVLTGGELTAYQNIISVNDSLTLSFKPSGTENKGADWKDSLKSLNLEITYIPTSDKNGEVKVYNPQLKPKVSNNIGYFGLTAKNLEYATQDTDIREGILEFRVYQKDADGSPEYLGDLVEVQLVNATEKTAGYAHNISESLGQMANKNSIDVNVLKTTFTKNPLLILFKIIEAGTEKLSFNNYNEYVNKIFCLGPEENKSFNSLNGRRFLPFNDTDSYRILKVATESFLMVNAGVCCDLKDIGSEEALIKHFANLDIRFAAGDTDKFQEKWNNYLDPKDKKNKNDSDQDEKFRSTILPYLYLIRKKIDNLNISNNWIDDLIKREYCNGDTDRNGLQKECFGWVQQRLQCPLFIELIWSYWQEEGMLVQGMNAISRRFQNMRSPGKSDPLAEMEISHLRPLNNLLWGYIQDEQHRLKVVRRAYEYDHHYGIKLRGKAVSAIHSADSRTRFIAAFHGLLNLATQFYADSSNRLVDPVTFPLLNALREVHFIIAEGMHNQYGDLPSTARIEMLMQQWILARSEFDKFLPGRAAIPYTEPWMDRVASMNKLQSWTDVSPLHYNFLAQYGEQLLLSIRFGNWSDPSRTADDASMWANYFRNQIQGYVHSYKTVTGVDLGVKLVGQDKVDDKQPSFHIAKRVKGLKHSKNPKKATNGIAAKNGVPLKEW